MLGLPSLNSLLDEQPPILELIEHARTAKWNLLGVKLELDSVALAECHDNVSMYQLWLEEKAEKATRRNVIAALRAIQQNSVAKKYEDYLKKKVSDLLNVLCYFMRKICKISWLLLFLDSILLVYTCICRVYY